VLPATFQSAPTAGQAGGRVQHPGQQPDGPATDTQIDVGVAKADVTGPVQDRLVVVGEPGQAGHGQSSSNSSTAKVTARSTSLTTRKLLVASGERSREVMLGR
jgi:hypothetical protein